MDHSICGQDRGHFARAKTGSREIDWDDNKHIAEWSGNFDHTAEIFFKNGMLLPHGARDELNSLAKRGRLAHSILKMKDRNEKKIEACIKALEDGEGELDGIKELKGPELGLVMLHFMTAYRGVLIAVYDDAEVTLETILRISKLVRRAPKLRPPAEPTLTPDVMSVGR